MEDYKQPKMVNWYNPIQLYATALKAVVSGTFASYADNREVQAALDKERIYYSLEDPKDIEDCDRRKDITDKAEGREDYEKRELWFDYISDTGDGFDPTYTVADLAAQSLDVSNDPMFKESAASTDGKLPAGEMLILGGDQVYPTPTKEEYDSRFKIPFRAASAKHHAEGQYPKMFAIPGNHDWYDGLSNFIKLFCQKRWIGNWRTEQSRSYFAIKLPHNYWLWAVDVQLNSDIDQPQKDYFCDIGKQMGEGDKVILCTSEPAWVYNKMRLGDETYKRLKFFEQVFITDDETYNYRDGKKFELVATITGDFHHYSRYEEFKTYSNGTVSKEYINHLITAGGGGAFLHPTHNLPETLKDLDNPDVQMLKNTQPNGKDPKRMAVFPSIKDSRRLSWNVLLFPFNNPAFLCTMAAIQLALAWLLQSGSFFERNGDFMHQLSAAGSFSATIDIILHGLYTSPGVLFLCLVILGGMYQFADAYRGKGYQFLGFLHGFFQLSNMFFFIWMLSVLNIKRWGIENDLWFSVVYFFEIFVGAIAGSFIFGIYLWLCNCLLGLHDNESFSSLAHTGYKNFLRFHIDKNGNLEIYPIGITKVATNWKPSEDKGEKMTFHTDKPAQYHLIEEPIIIKRNNSL